MWLSSEGEYCQDMSTLLSVLSVCDHNDTEILSRFWETVIIDNHLANTASFRKHIWGTGVVSIVSLGLAIMQTLKITGARFTSNGPIFLGPSTHSTYSFFSRASSTIRVHFIISAPKRKLHALGSSTLWYSLSTDISFGGNTDQSIRVRIIRTRASLSYNVANSTFSLWCIGSYFILFLSYVESSLKVVQRCSDKNHYNEGPLKIRVLSITREHHCGCQVRALWLMRSKHDDGSWQSRRDPPHLPSTIS
jgi:hypothetical protein